MEYVQQIQKLRKEQRYYSMWELPPLLEVDTDGLGSDGNADSDGSLSPAATSGVTSCSSDSAWSEVYTHTQSNKKTPKSCSFYCLLIFMCPLRFMLLLARWFLTVEPLLFFPNGRYSNCQTSVYFFFKRLACFSYGSYGRKPRE